MDIHYVKLLESESKMARPREHDRDKIASDLLEWAQKEDSINLNKFCAMNLLPFSAIVTGKLGLAILLSLSSSFT